jgi:hypothetical protein
VNIGNEISDVRFSVTQELHSALKTLRPSNAPPRIIWVDAICTNQLDYSERAIQVKQMREIYCEADRVIVWLGNGDNRSTNSLRIINKIDSRYQESNREENTEIDLKALHYPLMEGINVHEFLSKWPIFDVPWFRRTWVVQEICNAKSAKAHCGRDTIAWQLILQVNRCIRSASLSMDSSYKALMPPIFEDLFNSVTSVTSERIGILEVFIKGLDLDATDPRDKIFAMLQFGSETSDLSSLPPAISPNYNTPVVDVFAGFTRWWIVKHVSLRILSAIQALEGRTWQRTYLGTCKSEQDAHPSWSLWYRGHCNWALGNLGLPKNCKYHASADTKPDVGLILASQDLSVLPLTGFKIGTVQDINSYPYSKPPPGRTELHHAYVAIFDPFNYTGKWVHQLGSKHDRDYIYMDGSDTGHFAAHANESIDAALPCQSKCFFRTEAGLVGLCPFSTRPEDQIIIFYGGSVPYIVRVCTHETSTKIAGSETFELIGECYLEGYMEGEGVTEQVDKALPTRTFVLV